jgi:hypothetical protein
MQKRIQKQCFSQKWISQTRNPAKPDTKHGVDPAKRDTGQRKRMRNYETAQNGIRKVSGSCSKIAYQPAKRHAGTVFLVKPHTAAQKD